MLVLQAFGDRERVDGQRVGSEAGVEYSQPSRNELFDFPLKNKVRAFVPTLFFGLFFVPVLFAAGVAANTGRKGGGGGGGAGDKLRRRGLVLACLDVLGPTASCLSLIRQADRIAEFRPRRKQGILIAEKLRFAAVIGSIVVGAKFQPPANCRDTTERALRLIGLHLIASK